MRSAMRFQLDSTWAGYTHMLGTEIRKNQTAKPFRNEIMSCVAPLERLEIVTEM